MSVHTGNFARCALAAAAFALGSAFAARAEDAPNFAANPSAAWFSYSRDFLAPASGAGPVRPLPGHPHVSNDEYRLTGKQATFAMGDPDSPILQPWAAEQMRKHNALLLSGTPVFSQHASCWPVGTTVFMLEPMTRPMFIVQGPKDVAMILTSFSDVRHVWLTDKHSAKLKPSWSGESIGRYEGDALVIDTIGFNDKTFMDGYATPHTDKLHVTERLRLIDGGETMEDAFHVEDPGAFTMPWDAIQRYRHYEATVAKMSLKSVPVLATPADGPLTEAICAESTNSFLGLPAMPVPQASAPDF
jgi:hypothetical protein